MTRIQTWLSGFSPTGIAVGLSLLLIALHTVMLSGSFIKQRTARSLNEQVATLRDNMEQMVQIEEENQAELLGQLEAAQTEVSSLESQIPRPESSFAVYPEGFRLARQQSLDMLRVQRGSSEHQPTVLGQVNTEVFAIDVAGPSAACVKYLSALEGNGGITVALDQINIDPLAETCSLELRSVNVETP
ncbi:MAG: hypothetical protein WBR18_05005 [Anaerolineales bacterium]